MSQEVVPLKEGGDMPGVSPEGAQEDTTPSDDSALPPPVEAALEEIPPEQREKVRSMFLGLSQYMGPVPNPLLGKLTPQHLDKLIEGAENNNQRSFEDRDHHRKHVKTLALAGMAAFIIVAFLFLWQKQVSALQNLIEVAVVFAGGLGAGVGIRKKD